MVKKVVKNIKQTKSYVLEKWLKIGLVVAVSGAVIFGIVLAQTMIDRSNSKTKITTEDLKAVSNAEWVKELERPEEEKGFAMAIKITINGEKKVDWYFGAK